MPLILDLRAQLADRAHRARALIEYIQDNGLVGKVSQSARSITEPRLTGYNVVATAIYEKAIELGCRANRSCGSSLVSSKRSFRVRSVLSLTLLRIKLI